MKAAPALVALALLSSAGCAHVHFDASRSRVPASMTARVGRPGKVIGHFQKEIRCSWILWRLLPMSDVELAPLIEQVARERQADAVVNLRIHGESTFVDSLLTIGIATVAGGILSYLLASPDPAMREQAVIQNAASAALVANLVGTGGALYLPFFRTYTVEGDLVRFESEAASP